MSAFRGEADMTRPRGPLLIFSYLLSTAINGVVSTLGAVRAPARFHQGCCRFGSRMAPYGMGATTYRGDWIPQIHEG